MKETKTKKTETQAPERQPDEYKLIPWAELHPDPTQPRKSFPHETLAELAASIREQGIVQPLIVRSVKARFKILEPDLHSQDYRLMEQLADGEWVQRDTCDEKNIKGLREKGWPEHFAANHGRELAFADHYVIVAGERRWRAAELAGLTPLPCIVRDLDAQRKFAQQFVENSQRENVSALEEAEALAAQLTARKQTDATFNAEKLAQEIGMSRAALYGRLVLTRLHGPVREALLAGKISTSVAGVVAIVPTPKAQEKLLATITKEDHWKFPWSVRDVQEYVNDDYCRQLADAPFDVKASYYVGREDMRAACTGCPHRTGNLVTEFPELAKRPNVCTQPECFAAKCKAHWLATAEAAKAKGATVLTEKEFKSDAGAFTAQDEYIYTIGKYGTVGDLLGKHKPEPVLVSTATGLKTYFRKADLPAAYQAAKLKFRETKSAATLTPEQKAADAKQREENQQLGERKRTYVEEQLPALAKLLPKLKDGKAIELAAMLVKDMDGYWDDAVAESLVGKSKDAKTGLLGRLFADNEVQPVQNYGHEWNAVGVAAWRLAGIDLVAGFKKQEKTTQTAPLKLGKVEPKQKELVTVPATTKARIKAAQAARWAKLKTKVAKGAKA